VIYSGFSGFRAFQGAQLALVMPLTARNMFLSAGFETILTDDGATFHRSSVVPAAPPTHELEMEYFPKEAISAGLTCNTIGLSNMNSCLM